MSSKNTDTANTKRESNKDIFDYIVDVIWYVVPAILNLVWEILRFLFGLIAKLFAEKKEQEPVNPFLDEPSNLEEEYAPDHRRYNSAKEEDYYDNIYLAEEVTDYLQTRVYNSGYNLRWEALISYFSYLNSLLRRDDYESNPEVSKWLLYGARLAMSSDLPAYYKFNKKGDDDPIETCKKLIHGKSNRPNRYQSLIRAILPILNHRKKLISPFDPALIESSLLDLQQICKNDGLEFPDNLLYSDPLKEAITQANEQMEEERRGFGLGISKGRLIFLLICFSLVVFSLWYVLFAFNV